MFSRPLAFVENRSNLSFFSKGQFTVSDLKGWSLSFCCWSKKTHLTFIGLFKKKKKWLNIIFSILVKRPPQKGRVDVFICHWNTLAFKDILRGLSAEMKFELFLCFVLRFFFFPFLLRHFKRVKLWTKTVQWRKKQILKSTARCQRAHPKYRLLYLKVNAKGECKS